MHTGFPHWTGVLWCFPCVPCIHTQCSCAIIQGGSQMAVCSMAGDVKFSHHALNFFSLRTISGGYAFINPHSHIKLVLNALLSSSPKKKKKNSFFFLLFTVNSKQTVTGATAGADFGQTPSPSWANRTLPWQQLPEEVLYQRICSVWLNTPYQCYWLMPQLVSND